MQNDYYSDELENPGLTEGEKKRFEGARKFVDKLKNIKKQHDADTARNTPAPKLNQTSLVDDLNKCINVNLSDKSRLPFAPEIDCLTITKGKDGVLRMSGKSRDGKQSIDFTVKDGIAQFELNDGNVSRSYNNKVGGRWTWRNLKSSTTTRYPDNEFGENCAKSMAGIMDKVKAQYHSNINTRSQAMQKSGGRE